MEHSMTSTNPTRLPVIRCCSSSKREGRDLIHMVWMPLTLGWATIQFTMEYMAQDFGRFRWEGTPLAVGPHNRLVIMEFPYFGFWSFSDFTAVFDKGFWCIS